MLRILTCSLFKGMEFHEELHNLGAKEGLKGRKLNKATESFAWNITVLKVSACPGAPTVVSLPTSQQVETCRWLKTAICMFR